MTMFTDAAILQRIEALERRVALITTYILTLEGGVASMIDPTRRGVSGFVIGMEALDAQDELERQALTQPPSDR